jgi:hypothetical protein
MAGQQVRTRFGSLSDGDFTWRPMANDTKDYPDVPTLRLEIVTPVGV